MIEEREKNISRLCALCEVVATRAFVEVFPQTRRIIHNATLIGIEVKDKDAGLRLLRDIRDTARKVMDSAPVDFGDHE